MTTDRQIDRFKVLLANEQPTHPVKEGQLIDAARAVIEDSELASASISIAVVDDARMRRLNRQYLNHDWPTDVLSFALEQRDGHLEGEVIISADAAAGAAAELGWPAAAEQLLYVIHGTLHLVGYDDKSSEKAEVMRAAEAKYLRQFGYELPRAVHPGASSP